jgi:hypothetical protein
MTTPKKAADCYRTENETCARIIAADPERYPGTMQQWAALVIEKSKPTIKGPLFAQRAA